MNENKSISFKDIYELQQKELQRLNLELDQIQKQTLKQKNHLRKKRKIKKIKII